jgi:hypothetical protein
MMITKLNDKVEAYLLSYPKSGNTWVRYIIEYVSGIPTVYVAHMAGGLPWEGCVEEVTEKFYDISASVFERIGTLDNPYVDYPVSSQPIIDWREEQMVYDKGLILKKHSAEDIATKPFLDPPPLDLDSKLLFLVRDPRDAILRHGSNGEGGHHQDWRAFAKNVKYFGNYAGVKLLIYYEELLKYPRQNILKIATFLNGIENDKIVDKFMKDYDQHVETSAAAYRAFGYQTRTLALDMPNFGIGAYHTNRRNSHIRDHALREICQDPLVEEVLRPYVENRFYPQERENQ